MSFWGIEVQPGKEAEVLLERVLHVSLATLGGSHKGGRTVIYAVVEGKKFALAVLEAGRVDNVPLDHVFTPYLELKFKVEGTDNVTLTGYLAEEDDEEGFDEGDLDEEDFDDEDDDEDGEDDGDDGEDDEDDEGDDDEEEEEAPKEKGNKRAQPQKAEPAKKAKTEQPEAQKAQPAQKAQEKPQPKKEEKPQPKKEEKPQQKKEEKPQPKKEEKPQQKQQSPNPKSSGANVVTLQGGLRYEEKAVGSGAVAQLGKKVTLQYVGTLASNGKQFDAGKFTFRLGTGEVIKGFDVGVQDMKVGGRRVITVPPHLGYGNKKSGPIPANSTLIFDVKVVEVK